MSTQTSLKLDRIAEQMDVVLTQIFRNYVSLGSPTKLGGLRFLDVECSKTFAFEKTRVAEDGKGTLLVLSAPYDGKAEDIRHILEAGPHGQEIKHIEVRASSDVGKKDRLFIEVGYYIPISDWLTDEAIIAYAHEHKSANSHDALIGILETRLLPIASEIMSFLIEQIRINTKNKQAERD
ncbi:MAG: hypothetical protein Q4F00_08220 [bacterium]|nr:hypothetical protein [bacterium]